MAMDTMSQAIDMAFCTALVLTGAMKTAEAAVMQGIGACEDLSPRGLLIEASRAAVQRCTKSSDCPCEVERLPRNCGASSILQPLPRRCALFFEFWWASRSKSARNFSRFLSPSSRARLYAALIELSIHVLQKLTDLMMTSVENSAWPLIKSASSLIKNRTVLVISQGSQGPATG